MRVRVPPSIFQKMCAIRFAIRKIPRCPRAARLSAAFVIVFLLPSNSANVRLCVSPLHTQAQAH